MATFYFEPKLFNRLSNVEKGVIKDYKGSKNNKGLVPVTQQYFLTVKTCDFSYKITFVRKEAREDDKIQIYKRRKTPHSHTFKREIRAFDSIRETYRVEFIRENELRAEPLEINSIHKRGRFDWIVEAVDIEPDLSTVTTVEEVSSQQLYKGHLYGGRLILSVKEHVSPVNRVISKLCSLKNGGVAGSSGQELQSKTVKTLHASREPKPLDAISYAQVAADKRAHRVNKLEKIPSLMRGDYSELVIYDEDGKFVSREFSIASGENKGWKEFDGEYTVTDLGVSEKYKPLPMPANYKEPETQDKPDEPVMINLSEAEKLLKSMGYL